MDRRIDRDVHGGLPSGGMNHSSLLSGIGRERYIGSFGVYADHWILSSTKWLLLGS